jgi:hypothetical protein
MTIGVFKRMSKRGKRKNKRVRGRNEADVAIEFLKLVLLYITLWYAFVIPWGEVWQRILGK